MEKPAPYRVTLTFNGETKKFFSLFQGNDGSIYIHQNRDNKKCWQHPVFEQLQEETMIDFSKSVKTDFEPHKISFHPSGQVHIKNSNGEYYGQKFQNTEFSKITKPQCLCMLAPSTINDLPHFKKDKKSMVSNFVLPNNIAPFVMQLYLIPPGAHKVDVNGEHLQPVTLLPLSNGYHILFVLYLVKPKSEGVKANWPPYPFFILPKP